MTHPNDNQHRDESLQHGQASPGEPEINPVFARIDDEARQQQELFIAHGIDKTVIPGLKMGYGALTVQNWDSNRQAPGWTLTGANLTLDQGRPLGSLWYRHDDGRTVRVGVRWNDGVEQLEALCLHPVKPQLSDDVDGAEVARIERDARGRIAALVAINAEIGAWVATRTSEDAILAAAGLGLKRLDD